MLNKNELSKKSLMNSEAKSKQNIESETCENSNSENTQIKKQKPKKHYKRSVDFFQKKMEIDEIDEDFSKRRNTISIKGNYVPQIKPIKIDVIPSKLRLNKLGFKDLKCNKNNKVLLYANKYFISCPNIKDEEYNDENDYENLQYYDNDKNINLNLSKDNCTQNNEDMTQTRKKLEKEKKSIPKVYSVNNPHLKNKYNKELNIGYYSDSDFDESLNDSINENDEIKFELNLDDKDNKNNKDEINKKRERYNSWSILEILQKKNKLDEK